MIVVSDTTPLNYLILTETVHVLSAIFGRVYAPSAVIKELLHLRSPQAVGTWASSPPEWLTVQDPTHIGPCKLGRGRDGGDLTGPRVEGGPGSYRRPRRQ